MFRTYTVTVFRHHDSPGGAYAYLRDTYRTWQGACVHVVRAKDGRQAKRVAIAECKAHGQMALAPTARGAGE